MERIISSFQLQFIFIASRAAKKREALLVSFLLLSISQMILVKQL